MEADPGPQRAKQRFLHLLREISHRIADEPDETKVGNVGGFLDEVCELSEFLGFRSGPMRRLYFSRPEHGIPHLPGRPGSAVVWDSEVAQFLGQQYALALGFRIAGPEEWDCPRDLFIHCFCESELDGSPCLQDVRALESKAPQRDAIIRTLKQWRRAVTGPRAVVLDQAAQRASTTGPDTPSIRSVPKPSPLVGRRLELFNLLDGRSFLAKELARKMDGHPSEDSVRGFVGAIKKAGYSVLNKPGIGYFRPDSPPPCLRSHEPVH